MNDSKQRIDELTILLNQYNHQYYILDNPQVSDYEFDMLLKELASLEKENPEYVHVDSPTQRVGGTITKLFPTVKHQYPMLSLGNTYNQGELVDFHNRLMEFSNHEIEYVCELKYDGVAISLIYENGILVRAVTRGDGVQGDVVTNNVKTIYSIPMKLSGDFPEKFEIRGEIFMPHSSFERLNAERIENNEEPFANPRNAASGSLKLQDSALVAKRKLDCFLYFVLGENMSFKTHYEAVYKAAEWGFKVPKEMKVCKGMDEVWKFIDYWDHERLNLPFDIDGVVIKANSFDLQRTAGFTAKNPRWAISYKFKAERVATKLLSVVYQVGRTGIITPVANLEPVSLSGSIVRRASLHNADIMESLDIHYDDVVFVEKGGEIIPKIIAVDMSERQENAKKYTFIDKCPECGSKLSRIEGESAYFCLNESACPPQIKGKLEHFISRKAMNIDSLGEGKVEMLFDNNLVHNAADFYDLTYEKLIGLEKVIPATDEKAERKISFREKTVENILNAIEISKTIPFERLLFALGIKNVGETIAQKIAQHYGNIHNIMNANYESLISIDDVGDQIAKSVIDYFTDLNNMIMMDRLKAAGLQMEIKIDTLEQKPNVLQGKSFVVSGVFSISRDVLKKMIVDYGGKNTSSISSKTDFVLAGDKMGPEKLKKAENLKINIISEEEFYKMILV